MNTCPACGFVSLAKRGPGSAETCVVCGWIDDFEQLVHPDITYGANSGLCLRQAQQDLLASPARIAARAAGFERDPQWRPLRQGELPVVDGSGPSSPVCYVATPDPESYIPYWLPRHANTPTV
jgi:hypothetical protein